MINIRHLGYLVAMAGTVLLCCGFGWGLGSSDPCNEARQLVDNLQSITAQSKRNKIEESITKACPAGAPGKFIAALRAERAAKPAEALSLYRAAAASDPTLTVAHGNLGVLLHAEGQNDEAAVELSKGLQGANDPRYHRALAEIFANGSFPALALFHYTEALKAFPDDSALHAGAANVYQQLGRHDLAEKEILLLRKLKPVPSDYIPELARIHRTAGRTNQAIAELQPYLQKYPDDHDAHRLLAESLMEAGQREAARKEFLRAGVDVTINPEDFARKGDEFMRAREFGQAISAYQTALKGRPEWHDAQYLLGKAQMAAGRDEEALATFNALISSGYRNGEIFYEAGLLHERTGQYDDAIASYRSSILQNPSVINSRRRLAEIYTWHGNYREAADQYRELVRLRDDNPAFHLGLGKAYEKLKDHTGAWHELETVVKLDPNHLEGHRELGKILMQMGQAAAAEVQYKEVIRLHIDDETARNVLITLYVKQKRYDDLTTFVKEWLDKAPDDPQRLYRLGIVYEFKKEYDLATAQYKKVLEQQPENARALLALGRTYMKSGRLSESRDTLQRAREIDPKLTEVQLLLSSIVSGSSPGKSSDRKSKARKSRRAAVRKAVSRK